MAPFFPRTSSRPSHRYSFILRRGFLCLSIDFLFVRAVVPGLLLPAFFCFAPRCPSIPEFLPFVRRSSSRPSPTGFLLFTAAISIVFTPTFFCFPRYIYLCLTSAISFHFAAHILLSKSLAALCCRPSPNNRMSMKPYVCLLSC